MPTFNPLGGYAADMVAGSQGSSTYEGRHISVLESDMIHPTHADGFVDKGDPVVCGTATPGNCIVGVAMTSAAAATEFISVDTEGIWYLNVVPENDGGNSNLVFGDQVFINVTNGVLSKIRNLPTQRPFGYAVNTTTIAGAGTASVAAVKVHWDPWWWDYFHTMTVADNAWSMTAVTTDDSAADMSNGLFVQLTNTGDKTGTGTINCLGTDLYVNADVPYAYGHAGYTGAVSDHTVGFLCGMQWYMENCGDSCGAWVVADLNMNSADAPTGGGRHAYIRCREHGAVQAAETIVLCEGTAAATFLLTIDTVNNMLTANAGAGNLTHKLACYITAGALTRYLYLYDS